MKKIIFILIGTLIISCSEQTETLTAAYIPVDWCGVKFAGDNYKKDYLFANCDSTVIMNHHVYTKQRDYIIPMVNAERLKRGLPGNVTPSGVDLTLTNLSTKDTIFIADVFGKHLTNCNKLVKNKWYKNQTGKKAVGINLVHRATNESLNAGHTSYDLLLNGI